MESREINPWSAHFESPEKEAAFQAFVYKRNLMGNVGGVSVVLFLFIIYIFSDYIDAVNPHEVVAIRLVAFAISLGLLSLLLIKRFRRHNDPIVTAIVTLLGLAVDAIIVLQPSLDNTYYIAIIQGCILFALILRLSFPSMAFVVGVTQLFFMMAAFAKEDKSAAILQSSNLLMVGIISIAGVYLLQRYQRADFQKSETIRVQNEKLNILLADAKRDSERKLAAMNMLVHFVKTPLHQIKGFSDIVMNSLDVEDDRISISEGVQGARYIKNATANLSRSVNNLLTYHRLDDIDGSQQYRMCSINDLIYDFSEGLSSDIDVEVKGSVNDISTEETVLKTAMECLASYYNEQQQKLSKLNIVLSDAPDGVVVTLLDDGPHLSDSKFESETRPLTKLDNYLTSDGSEMSMSLRTVARAIEICGGVFAYYARRDGNEFTILLKDVSPGGEKQHAA